MVALDIMLLAALDAVSAASIPASRIALRALGLAAIAAAAAVNPAASISLLIAAFASLSTVLLPLRLLPPLLVLLPPLDDFEDVDLEDDFFADLAMFSLPRSGQKTLQRRNGSQFVGIPSILLMLKGTAAVRGDALRHGQRPKVWPFVSS